MIQVHPFSETNEKTYIEMENMKSIISDATDEDIFFAKERFKLHLTTPNEGVTTDILKKYFSKKYGF